MKSILAFFIPSLFGPPMQSNSSSVPPPMSVEDGSPRHPPFPYDPNARTVFYDSWCQVTAYPSVGGLVLGFFSAIELAHLKLSRFTPANRSLDLAEEDDLALRMLRLGAHWWPNGRLYERHKTAIDQRIPYDFHFPPNVQVGYPSSGGMWVLKFLADSDAWYDEDEYNDYRKPSLPKKPYEWEASMSFVLTMDERCDVLKGFGARFYQSEDCEDVPRTLEEGVKMGRRYEELLKKMEDDDYRRDWLEPPETEL